eukprot:XP_019077622.1 PREDICTED: probable polygalacturonase At1g80170 [Vitis vinifera]
MSDYGSSHLDCWIRFWRVNGLTVRGNGQIDGQAAKCVGSLRMNGGSAQVEEIHVDTCSFKGTQNGARIKVWQLDNIENPIIIDQYYCPHKTDCQSMKSAVQISDVSFTGFWGTSATDDAIKLSCIETVGCANITVDDISIKSASGNGETYSCINAHGTVNKTFPPLT